MMRPATTMNTTRREISVEEGCIVIGTNANSVRTRRPHPRRSRPSGSLRPLKNLQPPSKGSTDFVKFGTSSNIQGEASMGSQIRIKSFVLGFLIACSGGAVSHAEPQPLQFNSFFLHEAFNAPARTVQHVQSLRVGSTAGTPRFNDAWTYTFEQRWPVFGDRHQLSYEIPVGRAHDGLHPELGDVRLHYQYQLLNGDQWGLAPRAALVFPTGNLTQQTSMGSMGYMFEIAYSRQKVIWPWLEMHWNVGLTHFPNAANAQSDRASVTNVHINRSMVWKPSQAWNVMLEMITDLRRDVSGPGETIGRHAFTLAPGVRHAVILGDGSRIVPGLSVPLTLLPRDEFRWGVMAYLSIQNRY
jgi:hypothetical protein